MSGLLLLWPSGYSSSPSCKTGLNRQLRSLLLSFFFMSFLHVARWLGAFCLLVGSFTNAAPTRAGSLRRTDNGTTTADGPLVFCHFMVRLTSA